MKSMRTKKFLLSLFSLVVLMQPLTIVTGNSCSALIDELARTDMPIKPQAINQQSEERTCAKQDPNRYIKAMFISESIEEIKNPSRAANWQSDPNLRGFSPFREPCNVQPVEIVHNGRRTTVNIPLAPGAKPSPRALAGTVVHASSTRPGPNAVRTSCGNRVVYINVQRPSGNGSRYR